VLELHGNEFSVEGVEALEGMRSGHDCNKCMALRL
jgi:hypothetical protein